MKKVGIITFNKAVNYGAILQCFALHKALNALNINNEVIDYDSPMYKSMNCIKYKFKKLIEFILIKNSRDIRHKKFQIFLANNVRLSHKVYNNLNIYQTNKIYDSFLVGSDQVWNLEKTEYDTSFLLDFVKKNKIKSSYASSTGYIEDIKPIVKYLKDFNNISVRESNTKIQLESLLKRTVERLLDPTLLLNKVEWQKYSVMPKESSYILIYTLTKSKNIRRFAKKLSKETGLKIIEISVRAEKYRKIKKLSKLGIEEFLGYFNNTEYIVTNSFHGLAFSIIFEKQFFYGYHDKEELGNNRLETILEIFSLKDRKIDINKSLNDYDIINYKNINKIKRKEQKKSFDFLKKLEGVKK